MPIKAMIVDDSGFFRRRLTEILNQDPGIEVIGSASNGREAVEKVAILKPDVITMDIEMPEMDGITAVRKIMASHPTPVLMFSSLTREGAQATLDALDAGAMDFLPKKFQDIAASKEEVSKLLCSRVREIATKSARLKVKPAIPAQQKVAAPAATIRPFRGSVQLVAIGTSTGGPVALQAVLSKLPENYPHPVLVVQHMPAAFTSAFAERLDQQCKIHVKEAEDGDIPRPGTVYIAPGGRQMGIGKQGASSVIRITDAKPDENYKPSVDILFQSLSESFPGKVLGIILTGMGADGTEGARKLKSKGALIWSQDEESSTIYGMPMSIAKAGLSDRVLSLSDVGDELVNIG